MSNSISSPMVFKNFKTFHYTLAGRPLVPALAAVDYANPDFTQTIPLDDTLAMGVLPYALAGHLSATENDDLSAWLMQQYNMKFADLRSRIPSSFEPISTPYGLF